MHEPLPLHHVEVDGGAPPVQHVLRRDYETRSKLSIKSVGVHRYASHPSTEVVWIAFAVDDQPVGLVWPSDGAPPEFIEAAQNPTWTVEAQAAAPEIDAELAKITGGAVTKINQVAKLLAWLQQNGCTLQKLDKPAIERQLEQAEELPAAVQRVLELRLGGAQAAVKKIDALLARAGEDDRVRGAFRYHGASTGRWSGEGFQPQNLKRPVVEDLDAAIAAVATGEYAHMQKLYPRPLSVVGDCSRSMIMCGAWADIDRRRFRRDREPCSGLGCWRRLEARRLSPLRRDARSPRRAILRNGVPDIPCSVRHPTRRTVRSGTSGKPVI